MSDRADASTNDQQPIGPAVTGLSSAGRTAIGRATELIAERLRRGGMLFVAGNGGSFADALHIAGELAKDFEHPRPLPPAWQARIRAVSGDAELAAGLRQGLRVVVLGVNPVVVSAVDNDLEPRHAALAQELCALGRAGDVLLVLSTSGASRNLVNAAHVAHSIDASVVAIIGPRPAALTRLADVVITVDGKSTAEIQANYVEHYHELCRQIERAVLDES